MKIDEGGIGGPRGLEQATDKLVQNLMLDLLQTAAHQAGVRMSPASQCGLQELRDMINCNQNRAAHQCFGKDRPQRPGEAHGGPMSMLMMLMLIMERLMRQMDAGDHHGCAPNDHATQLAPRNKDALNVFIATNESNVQIHREGNALAVGVKFH